MVDEEKVKAIRE
jgi:hypothetical protein